MSELAVDLRQLRASSWVAIESTSRWLAGAMAATPQSLAAVFFAAGASHRGFCLHPLCSTYQFC